MEIRDASSNFAIALSPEDLLIGDSAIEEFRSGVRDHKTGKLLGTCAVRSAEKDTSVLVGRIKYYLVIQRSRKRFTIDAPDVPSATDFVLLLTSTNPKNNANSLTMSYGI
ncbi:hypothetical protein BT96DRAFT_970955 [Gymnopus androsaceus JB14]|uniref:Uncharacterized protein n=1 Tax=Gymnopus androsaceus JB14 TaxID=1447944 RepID=A0A6A4IGH7_9AGAR|nr:hypothetical protein BT96DRAFT_970955 [Gymnopus androsaceus JB14]